MATELIIADDHPLYRAALRGAVAAACAEASFVEASSVVELLEVVERHPHADLLLLDLNMPGAHGFSALAHLRGLSPNLPILVVSALEDRRIVQQALALGAVGYLSKSAEAATIGESVRAALRGEVVRPRGLGPPPGPSADGALAVDAADRLAGLTPQQFRVFSLLCSGRLNKQIAAEMQIGEATVKAHMTAILRKLGVLNRTQAVLLAGRLAVEPDQLVAPAEEVD